jgi:DMSO/TMAO reductase YedYZ molybdopterin-dependent catalytic subunit
LYDRGMTKKSAFLAGLLAGFIAALAMTVVMIVLARAGVATPLAIIGDRLSVFIPPGPFLSIMGKVGGYNHLKQLGVGSTIGGILLVGGAAGGVFAAFWRHKVSERSTLFSFAFFILLPLLALTVVLWPVLGTSYRGLPIQAARLVTLVGFCLSLAVFERTFALCFRYLIRAPAPVSDGGAPFTPTIGRRALILGGLGLVLAGGGAAIMRKLYRMAAFSYDGTQYKGRGVLPITPNDLFYCVTKNVIDPTVSTSLWHLEIDGLVQTPRSYRYEDLMGMDAVEQETTLMCISNGLDAGLMSNAVWKGIPMRDLLDQVAPLADAGKVRMHGVDNYTDTIPLEKAMDSTTLLAFQMNGVPLPNRHGFPFRAIVPGYFGEKHVKWITRIELAAADAKGFYETQGWGPDFITPTRSRIDVPDDFATFSLASLKGPIEVKGVAYGGDRGISRVELSFDDGETWDEADVYYAGGDLAWSLWNAHEGWTPSEPGEYNILVRATDGEGAVQEIEYDRSPYSGTTGFHRITVYVMA